MPRGRKRKDPGEAPIDGDYTPDIVLNKQSGYTYKWLSADDIPRFKQRGYTVEKRADDSARPAFDSGAETNEPDFKFGQLTLYKAPTAVAERMDKQAQLIADQRMTQIRSIASASGGEFTSQHQG